MSLFLVALAGGLVWGCQPGRPQAPPAEAVVAQVQDGDTVALASGQRVRLLGLDAPELERDGRPAEFLAHKAKHALAEMTQGRRVRLEYDQLRYDHYGRLLAYVFAPEGQNVSVEIVRQGLAHVYLAPPNVRFKEELLAAQGEAMAAHRGVWLKALKQDEPHYLANKSTYRFHRPSSRLGQNISPANRLKIDSLIREMTRICIKHRGVNLAQGFPDFPAPAEIKEAALKAIQADLNQYAITWGTPNLRQAIAEKFAWYNGAIIDPEKEITVCCGSTEAMISSLMAIVNSSEEVIVFEPFYENYGPDTILCDAKPRFITLHEPDWHFDEKELTWAFNNKTKAIIINTPNNPTGKVFSREELQFIADLCLKYERSISKKTTKELARELDEAKKYLEWNGAEVM